MNRKQAAEKFDLTIDTLRYYESVGAIPPVQRNENGYRNYTKRDLNWIFLVKSLRRAGLSIESLIEFASLAQLEDDYAKQAQKQVLCDQLQEIDDKIKEMNQTRALLQYKIDTFDEHLAKFQTGELTNDTVEELWKMAHFK